MKKLRETYTKMTHYAVPDASDEAYVIDSFAWIEYFMGSASGAKAKSFIESGSGITPSIVIAELSEKYRREKIVFAQDLDFIIGKTRVVPLDTGIAQKAGALNHDRKRVVKPWGLADSIVLATARECKARIVTGDEHFRDLIHETVMIK